MNKTLLQPQRAACECGACQFQIAAVPTARFVCHCTICQSYTGKLFADVTIIRAKDVDITGVENIAFKKYRLPPNINRGLCKCCGKPAIEFSSFWPAKIAFIPTANFALQNLLPPVAFHMFYHRRRTDVFDEQPKYSGYLNSEYAVAKLMMGIC